MPSLRKYSSLAETFGNCFKYEVFKMTIELEETFTVGQNNFFESTSPLFPFGVTFEDDLTTGYFYAVNTIKDLQILDALHIYNVSEISDKSKPCKIQFVWTDDGKIASLLINKYCHAIYDFDKQESYSRNGFPKSNKDWSKNENRILTDDIILIKLKDNMQSL